jgi:hypothetical protein
MFIILARVAPPSISEYDFAPKGSVPQVRRNSELERGRSESQKQGRLGPRLKLRIYQVRIIQRRRHVVTAGTPMSPTRCLITAQYVAANTDG